MKTKKLLAVLICLTMMFAVKAQTTALTFSDLQTQFAAASASGVPSTINIGAAIAVNADMALVSAGDSITLNFTTFPITVSAGTLTIGNKLKITTACGNTFQALAGGTIIVNAGCVFVSTATSPITAAGGNVTINGGKITTNNFPAASAGLSNSVTGGTLTINGGYLVTTATGTARGVGIDFLGTCIINGGEIHSDMGGGRGVSINATGAGGKLIVTGGKITALGATGRAIQLDNANATGWISGSPVITGGLEAIIAQKYAVAVLSGTPVITGVIGTNLVAGSTPPLNPILYDARGIIISATPGSGNYTASQNVTISASSLNLLKYTGASSGGTGAGVTNPATITASLVYTTDGSVPVVASTAYTTPVTVAVPSTLTVSPLISTTTLGTPVVFTYAAPGTPVVAAPTPPVYAAPKVTSIFSEAYANVTGTDFNPGWGQSGSDIIIQVAGNNTLKMSNLNYQGIQFGSPVNALPMNYLHLDLFTSDETSFQVFCISAATGEKFFQLPTINLNVWNSYDIPLTAFTSQGLGISDLIQFKFVGSGGKTVYLDNLYFYNTDPTPDAVAPTAFTASKGLVASDAVTLLLTATDNSGAVNYEITYGTTTIKTSGISGVQKTFQVTPLTGSTDYSFSVVCKDATGNVASNSPIIVTATTLSALPGAPVPTLDAVKVISIFSDTYTNVAATDFNPNWGQTTVESMVLLSGNNTIKYANLNYQGIALASFVDASMMSKLHVDVYPIDETSLQITPISPATPNNKEFSIALTPLNLNAWNSYNIPLASFTGVNMANVIQFKFTGSGGKTVYVDNLYFFNDVNNSVAKVGSTTIKCYPSQVIDRLNVRADSQISQVTVRNLLGQSVKSVVVNSTEKTIELSAVSAGNYFVTVKLANGQSATQKIVKL